MSLVQRHKVLAFFGVTGESTTVYHRMKKFTQLAMSKTRSSTTDSTLMNRFRKMIS